MKIMTMMSCILFACTVHGADIGLSPAGDVNSLGKETNRWPAVWSEFNSQSPNGLTQVLPPVYIDADSVAFSNGGFGYANGKFFAITNQQYDLTSLATAYDWHYGYINDDQSKYPTNLIFYDSTSDPVRVSSEGFGFYNSTSILDKLVWSLTSSNGAVVLYSYEVIGNEVHYDGESDQTSISNLPTAFLNATPNNAWNDPNVQNTDVLTPINIDEVGFYMSGVDSGSSVEAWCAPAEDIIGKPTLGLLPNTGATGNVRASKGGRGFDTIVIFDSMKLGPSRKIKGLGIINDEPKFSWVIKWYSYNL